MPFRSTILATAATLALAGGSAFAQSPEAAKPAAKSAAAVTKAAPKAAVSGTGAKAVNEATKAKTGTPLRSAPAGMKSDGDGCHSKGSAADA